LSSPVGGPRLWTWQQQWLLRFPFWLPFVK
jgi:hypothetical protein